jgi:TonB dependent receptor/TonB-dependent Receptor Plug Domain
MVSADKRTSGWCHRARLAGGALPLLVVALMPVSTQAQTAPAAPDPLAVAPAPQAGDPDRRVFAPAFFAPDTPQSALDMVSRVPGFSIDDGDDARGFGATAGNVLIDGARPTSKGEDLETFLARIPASSVERVELLSGAAAGALAPGKSQVVNVVRKAGAGSGGTWRLQGNVHSNGYVQPRLEAAYTVRRGEASFTVGARHNINNYNDLNGFEGFLDPQGRWLERGPNFDRRRGETNAVNVSANGRLAGMKLSANARLETRENDRRWIVAAIRTGETAPYRRDEGGEFDLDELWEVGGDLETDLIGWSLRLAVLAKTQDERTRDIAGFNPVALPAQFTRFTTASRYGERIGRATAKRGFGAHNVEIGAERALTTLVFSGDLAEGTSRDGNEGFVIRPGAIADTDVEETRTEAFLSDSWTLSPRLTLELMVTGEWSTIAQNGPANPGPNGAGTGAASSARDFFYAKPRAKLAWRPFEGWLVRAEAERAAGQLDFFAFADSAAVNDGSQNSGNPELRPEQTTSLLLGVERRWGKRGVLNVSVVNEDIEDKLTLVPVGAGGVGLGNIPSATRWGFNWSATVPLDWLAKGLEIEANQRWRSSAQIDPLTGRERPFSGWDGNNFNLNLRHDLPARKLIWGAWLWRGDANRDFRPTQTFEFPMNRAWGMWVETKAIAGVSLELGVDVPNGNRFRRIRTDFVPDRATGMVSRVQYRERRVDGVWYLLMRGTM